MALQENRLAEIRKVIPEIDVADAAVLARSGVRLLDIREPDEIASGSPPGAVRIPRAFLEMRIEAEFPNPTTGIMVLCGSGVRSLFVAHTLMAMGYKSVQSIRGGYAAWSRLDLPVERPRVLTAEQRDRYKRHLTIPEVGEAGQARLMDARVAIVGAGGLGSPIIYYLAAAGVGTLRVFDDDLVERSNLQRQILHGESRIGKNKAQSAAMTVAAFNPDVTVDPQEVRLTAANAIALLDDVDVIVDASDNLATRQVANDAATALGIPLVYGAIFRFEGQVSVFWPGGPTNAPCYRCLFPEEPPAELTPSCAEAGVLGVLPGIVGTLMASEALKLLLGRGTPLTGRLLTFDALSGRVEELEVDADPECPNCTAVRNTDVKLDWMQLRHFVAVSEPVQ